MKSIFPFLVGASLVAAGEFPPLSNPILTNTNTDGYGGAGGGHGGGPKYVEYTTTECFTTSIPVHIPHYDHGKTSTETSWSYITSTSTYVKTDTITTTTTEYYGVPTTVPTTIEYTVPTTIVDKYTDVSYVQVVTTVYVTSLTTQPAATIYITSTSEVEVEVTDTVTTTSVITTTTASPSCDFCKIDIYATGLVFPTVFETTTRLSITYEIFKTVYPRRNTTSFSTSTITATPACSNFPITWSPEGFNVILTSPTTYIAYTNFSHGFLEPRPTLFGCGELVSTSLDLGSFSTDWPDLIIPAPTIPTVRAPAPTQLAFFLDTIPTVVSQLSGVPAISCDEPSYVCETATPTATATITNIVPGAETLYAAAETKTDEA